MSDTPATGVGSTLHPLRTTGRTRAADLAAAAQRARLDAGDDGCSDRALAKRWAISHTAVATLFNAASGRALTLGDVLALPRALARDMLVRALAALDDAAGLSPRETVDRLTIELGGEVQELLSDLADDGVVNRHAAHAARFARIATLALRGQLAAAKEAAK